MEIQIEEGEAIKQLSEAVKQLKEKTSWIRNISIENKQEQLQKFKRTRSEGGKFRPNFRFKDFEEEKLLQDIEKLEKKTEKITEKELEKYGSEVISAEDLQHFFQEIFQELNLYVKLAANIEDEESWRRYSEKIWPAVDKAQVKESREKLEQGFEEEEGEKDLSPDQLKQMWKKEVERLGMDYSVECRDVGGCFNIPEKRQLVVAKGSKGGRKYSQQEAEMLTMHEIFHAVRAYNGFKAGKDSGFPPILGIHTPFYDQTEEGGALFREKKTGTMYAEKEKDYHLRLVAAYRLSETQNFQEEFQKIVEELVDLGASRERAFQLVARNREAIRHHIYLSGFKEWQEKDKVSPLLLGKVNDDYAELFQKETEAGGMIQKPEIGEKALFDFRFK